MRRAKQSIFKNRILMTAGNLIYPPHCALCDHILGKNEDEVCCACRKKIHFISDPKCSRCGRPLTDDTEEYCEHCRTHIRMFEEGFAPFVYDGVVKEAIMRLKYGHRAEHAVFFARAMYCAGRDFLNRAKPQMIVPVPIHRGRSIRRGYNQAGLLAEKLSHFSGIPCQKKLITRVRGTMPQKELDMRQRRKNLRGVFRVNTLQGEMPDRILVVDDIFTTGSTIDTIAACLLRAGAKSVYFACATIAPLQK
ncbi:MAG: ComF family protein [Eubacterium sp.]|nr:ComF family protein [Eubacterium sp.]